MSLAAAEKARRSAGEIALADERTTLTWGDLDLALNRTTNAILAGQATAPGRIAVFAPNSAETVLAYLAALHAGVSSVPTHFQRLLALPPDVRRKYDVSSIVGVSHTGAACPRDVKQRMIDWFGPGVHGSLWRHRVRHDQHDHLGRVAEEAGVGRPDRSAVRADRRLGRRRAPGPERGGGLYFRDTTGRGIIYHNDDEKTRAAHLEPGVFTLGEVGYVDEDGYVFITDRVSDLIVSGGVNIYPAEAEQVLIQHPGVADVAVVGAPNAEMGEEVKALIVPADPRTPPSPIELDRLCRERLAGFKCPRSYDFTDDIGRNAMGKINKRALRRRFWPSERTIGG